MSEATKQPPKEQSRIKFNHSGEKRNNQRKETRESLDIKTDNVGLTN